MKGLYASIHNEIHKKIGIIKRQGRKPCRIYLGRKASIYFYAENFESYPQKYLGLPVTYNDKKIIGVFVSCYNP